MAVWSGRWNWNWNALHAASVNGCSNLRPDNFDRPFLLLIPTVDDLQGFLSRLCFHNTRSVRPPHPAAGYLHLDMPWCTAGAQTSERGIYRRACRVRSSHLPSLPQLSRSYDLPPPMPRLAHSRCPQSRPPRPRLRRPHASQRQHRCASQG
jgi:hypothetical protein